MVKKQGILLLTLPYALTDTTLETITSWFDTEVVMKLGDTEESKEIEK